MGRADEIVSKAIELGYDTCGIVRIDAMHGYAKKVTERIERFPDMQNQAARFYGFARLEAEYPWAKSVIICARWYGKYHIPESVKGHIGKFYLTDNRLNEQSQDQRDSVAFEQYLNECGIRTMTNRKFGITALRWAALQAGIGIVRKNNFFYSEKGSWLFLEAFLTDQDIEWRTDSHIEACPENCRLCIKACPTQALAEPYMMNRSTCISCLTTWDGWDLTTNANSVNMGEWIYGCDACQDICPFNRHAWTDGEEFAQLAELGETLSLEQIVSADDAFLKNTVQPRFWYIPKDKTWRFKTNALNAMLNGYKPAYLASIQNACLDPDEHVRAMAKWVLSQLQARQ